MVNFGLFGIVPLLIQTCYGHMAISEPCVRNSPRNECNENNRSGKFDYDVTSPIGKSGLVWKPLCRWDGEKDRTNPLTWYAGQTVKVEFFPGGATHNGGHCQFALSYNGGADFVVIKDVFKHCFFKDLSFDYNNQVREYEIELPHNLPSSDNVVFAWTWINAIGDREYYMNCFDVNIIGNGSDNYTGKKLLIANYGPSTPHIPEFNGNYETGMDLLMSRPKMTVYSNDITLPPKIDNNQSNSIMSEYKPKAVETEVVENDQNAILIEPETDIYSENKPSSVISEKDSLVSKKKKIKNNKTKTKNKKNKNRTKSNTKKSSKIDRPNIPETQENLPLNRNKNFYDETIDNHFKDPNMKDDYIFVDDDLFFVGGPAVALEEKETKNLLGNIATDNGYKTDTDFQPFYKKTPNYFPSMAIDTNIYNDMDASYVTNTEAKYDPQEHFDSYLDEKSQSYSYEASEVDTTVTVTSTIYMTLEGDFEDTLNSKSLPFEQDEIMESINVNTIDFDKKNNRTKKSHKRRKRKNQIQTETETEATNHLMTVSSIAKKMRKNRVKKRCKKHKKYLLKTYERK
ncbi:hypothetical protein AYI70_g9975 [Smittium culicis]|uniref:Chitin-binding type-4 domain-containing protein n=1 Tax=Smittium culicis TaxID=133412 RepID=A0A1R1X8Q0_9FUNG|nr:hypothetical protein AYI70_g9975 [Smittium culicis]